jgi:hypothetical protein
MRSALRVAALVAFTAPLALVTTRPVAAQYFGRQKVQYDNFDWRVLDTNHFNIHFYPEEQ